MTRSFRKLMVQILCSRPGHVPSSLRAAYSLKIHTLLSRLNWVVAAFAVMNSDAKLLSKWSVCVYPAAPAPQEARDFSSLGADMP